MLWWKYAVVAAKDGYVAADGRMATDLPQMISDNLIEVYATSFDKAVRDLPNAGQLVGAHLAKLLQFKHWVPLVAQYELCGRQIFDLHDALVVMLDNTDLGECTLEGWLRPYDAFYVRFGRQDHIKLPFEGDEFEYLDGAFIAVTPFSADANEHRLKIGFTTVKKDGRGVMLPGYFIDFQPHEQRMLVTDAIESALARKMAEFDVENGTSEFVDALNSHRRVDLEDSIRLLRAGATLLVNSLFYLESLGGHLPDSEPGRDTPPSLVAQWHQGSPARRNKRRSALTADGYAVVRMVGRELEQAATGLPSMAGQVRAHWRRGHWRWQRHGPRLVERKRIWIKPLLVGSGRGDETMSLPGHIYVAHAGDAFQ